MISPELNNNDFLLGSPEFVLPTNEQAERIDSQEEIDISLFRKERGIIENLNERFDGLLKEKGWNQILDITETTKYPTVDQWVDSRIRQNRATKFFPCFVKTREDEIRFLKVQICDNDDYLKGLQDEANILGKDILPVPSPKLIESGAASENSLAYNCLEAIKFEQGRVGNVQEWRPEHADSAAEQIQLIEQKNLDNLPKDIKNLPQFQREVRITERLLNMAGRSGNYLPLDIADEIQDFASKGEIREVMVHGDMKLKNIIINRTGTVSIVDMELVGKGFIGQDAGKLMNNLESNPATKNAFFESYTRPDGETYDKERLRGVYAGIIAENLVDLVWRIENNHKSENVDFDIVTKTEMNAQISSIRTALQEYKLYSEDTVMNVLTHHLRP